jgi:RHS repeat-associated protein
VVVEVYFDDFKVEHVKSPVVSSQDYYPFGLTFGHYQRESSFNNQYQYNGKELQDELNLEWLDFHARQYEPAIGRFMSIDPASELMRRHGPYNFAFDSPLRFMDPDGMKPRDGITVERKRYDEEGNQLSKISFKRAHRIETKVTVHNAKVVDNSNSDMDGDRKATKAEVKEAGETMAREIADSWTGTSTNKKGQAVTTSVEFTGEITVIDNVKQAKESDFVMDIKPDGEVTRFSNHLGGARRGGNKIDVGFSSSYLRDIKERNDSGGSAPIPLVGFGETRVAGHEFGHSGGLPDRLLGNMMGPDTYKPTYTERKNFFRGR